MKNALKLKLSSLFERLEDARRDKERIIQAETDCIEKNGYIGCWNCKSDNKCTISETRLMVESRIKFINSTIVAKVEEWLNNAES